MSSSDWIVVALWYIAAMIVLLNIYLSPRNWFQFSPTKRIIVILCSLLWPFPVLVLGIYVLLFKKDQV